MNNLTKSLLAIGVLAAALTAAASEPTDRIRDYQYDAGGNILRIGSDVFTYDRVDRVLTGTVSGRARAYTYDAFGNRRKCTDVASNSDCQYGATITASTNRIDGATYDDQGDLTQYAGQTYDYDEAGMLKRGPGGVEYIYTADDERIAVVTGTTWTWSMRDASGKVLREMTSSAGPGDVHVFQWSRDHVFRSGTLLSPIDPASGTRHYHTDHLGTPRVVSDTTGAVVGVHDYFAFGLEVGDSASETNPARLKFTGHERDASGLDYMHARYSDAKWGRFLAFDRVWSSADLPSPQSWNRYAYARNNPVNRFDPDGLSSLVYNGNQGYIALYSGEGILIGAWPAANNVDSGSKGVWPDGTFTMFDKDKPYTHGGTKDTRDGEYGTRGIFRADNFTDTDGDTRSSMGVHAGRENDADGRGRTGPAHATLGCIRTTEEAMEIIAETAAVDPIETIDVTRHPVPPQTDLVPFGPFIVPPEKN